MSDYRRDPDDDWSRLGTRLRERIAALTESVISGTLTPEQYAAECGKLAEIGETFKLIRLIRRGEDINPPREQADTAISPEDR